MPVDETPLSRLCQGGRHVLGVDTGADPPAAGLTDGADDLVGADVGPDPFDVKWRCAWHFGTEGEDTPILAFNQHLSLLRAFEYGREVLPGLRTGEDGYVISPGPFVFCAICPNFVCLRKLRSTSSIACAAKKSRRLRDWP